MKKYLSLFALVLFSLSLVSCASGGTGNTTKASKEAEAEPTEVIVFAAASMTEALTEVGTLYEAQNPNIHIVFTFDSSGTLKTQIEEGADCDVYIAASQKPMNQLDAASSADLNPDGLDFVMQGTRVNILENKVTLCVPKDNPAGIMSFDDFAAKLSEDSVFFAMGNADVPVGQYAQKILAYYALDEAALAGHGCITYGSNVKEVVTQIEENTVDCGIVYGTDAFSSGLTVIDEATPEMCGQVVYPAAVINGTPVPEAAQAFLDFLRTDQAAAIFESVGFTALN